VGQKIKTISFFLIIAISLLRGRLSVSCLVYYTVLVQLYSYLVCRALLPTSSLEPSETLSLNTNC